MSDLGKLIWDTSRADEGSISVAGADIIAAAIESAGWARPAPVSEDDAEALSEAIRDLSYDGSSGPMLGYQFMQMVEEITVAVQALGFARRVAASPNTATPRIVRTEWGVRDLTGAITPYYMERSARYFAERGEGELLSREVTEWQPFTPTESGEPQAKPLDPYPWKSQIGAHRTAEEMLLPTEFKPDAQYEQDQSKYGTHPESGEQTA